MSGVNSLVGESSVTLNSNALTVDATTGTGCASTGWPADRAPFDSVGEASLKTGTGPMETFVWRLPLRSGVVVSTRAPDAVEALDSGSEGAEKSCSQCQ